MEAKKDDYENVLNQLYEALKDENVEDFRKVLQSCDSDFYQYLNCPVNSEGQNLLLMAIEHNQLEICRELIAAGSNADASVFDMDERTSLHFAVNIEVDSEIMQLLIDNGADLNAKDESNNTPVTSLFYATDIAETFQFDKFHMLINAGASVQSGILHGEQTTHESVQIYHSAKREKEHDVGEPPCVSITKILHSKGAPLDDQDVHLQKTPLHYACNSSCYVLVKYLIDNGVDAMKKSRKGDNAIAELAKIPFFSNSFLDSDRYINNTLKCLDLLIDKGVPINEKNMLGDTPLHVLVSSAASQTPALIQAFVDNKADVRILNKKQENALSVISIESNEMRVESARNELQIKSDVVKTLMRNGCNLEQKNTNGRTPLILAVLRKDFILTKVLLKCRANVYEKDNSELTCIDYMTLDKYDSNWKEMVDGYVNDVKWQATNIVSDFKEQTNERKHEKLDAIKRVIIKGRKKNFPIKDLDKRNLAHILGKKDVFDIDSYCLELLTNRCNECQDINVQIDEIRDEVQMLLERLSSFVQRLDARFAFTPVLSGSMREGTKIGQPDEFDYLLYMDQLNVECEIIDTDQICGFVHVKGTEQYLIKDVLENNLVMGIKFQSMFYSLIQESLGCQDIWSGLHFLWESGPIEPNRFGSILCLSLRWTGNHHSNLIISVDLPPVIHLTNWLHPDMIPSSMLVENPLSEFGSLVVLCKHAYSCMEKFESYLRLSFSHLECEVFDNLPFYIKRSYILAKVFVQQEYNPISVDHPSKLYISSYMLKMALFHEYSALLKDSQVELEPTFKTTKTLTRRMFVYLRDCIRLKTLPSYFYPKQNVLSYHENISGIEEEACVILSQLLELN